MVIGHSPRGGGFQIYSRHQTFHRGESATLSLTSPLVRLGGFFSTVVFAPIRQTVGFRLIFYPTIEPSKNETTEKKMIFDLPCKKFFAWLSHTRDFEDWPQAGYVATYSLFYGVDSKLNHSGQAYGVMDDFGNFVEVHND